ncbi:hypothetical protein A1Q_4776 [Vibrio campbellii HY01]|nr:hypothetical protein A1Q_4776 [Vibrio campbellii HY01]
MLGGIFARYLASTPWQVSRLSLALLALSVSTFVSMRPEQ